jgi:hypothetical protein
MKKTFAIFGLVAGFSVSAMAADFNGYVIDQMCSTNAAMKGNVECAQKCIKGGSPAVLVTDDGKVYKFADQAKAIPLAGQKVTVSGKLKGDTITIAKINPA